MPALKSMYSGRSLDLENPILSDIHLEDIVHALPLICRFGGHCDIFYSVAQHSIIGSLMFLREGMVDEAFEFLLHDAHEIYVGDMSTGLKTICPDFKCIEHRVESIVREKFGLPPVITPIVKVMDLRMLATEKNQILHNSKDEYWPMLDGYPPLNFEIEEQSYQHVRKRFIGMFEELRGSYKGAPYGKLTFGNTT